MHNEPNAHERVQGPPSGGVRHKPYRVAEVAAFLDVHESTIYKDIDAGRLRALRVGGKRGTLRILPSDLDAYLTRMATAAPVLASVLAEVRAALINDKADRNVVLTSVIRQLSGLEVAL